jgi:hypothetical protein
MSDSELNKSNKQENDWKESVRQISSLSSQKIGSDLSDVSKLENVARFDKIQSYELDLSSSRNNRQIFQDNYTINDHLTEDTDNKENTGRSNKKCKCVYLLSWDERVTE